MRSAVIYYSLEGNTRAAAEKLAGRLGADLFEVRTVKPYPKKGLAKFLVGGKDATLGKLPAIEALDIDPSAYDVVVLAFPLWAGKAAAPINSALDKLRFGMARVAVMVSSASGDAGSCAGDIAKKLGRPVESIATLTLKNPGRMEEAELSSKLEGLVARVQHTGGGGAF